jgi:hypothetical protein
LYPVPEEVYPVFKDIVSLVAFNVWKMPKVLFTKVNIVWGVSEMSTA